MSDKSGSNEQLEDVKRFFGDLVADMKSRNLLLPAIALVIAIAAAVVVLPKKSAEVVAQPPTAPVVQQPAASVEKAIQISLIAPTAMGEAEPLTSSSNPFIGSGGYNCTTISSGDPRVLSCEVSDLKVRVVCPPKATEPPCSDKGSGGAAGGGASGSAGGGSTSSTGGNDTGDQTAPGGDGKTPVVVYVYKATVEFDGKTYKDLEQGEKLPSKGDQVAVFGGVNESATRANFKAVEGSMVTDAQVDKTGLVFTLKPGQTASITDPTGTKHKLKLVRISKVKV